MLLAQIDTLTVQIDTLTGRIADLISALPDDARMINGPDDGTAGGVGASTDPAAITSGGGDSVRIDPSTTAECARLGAIERLDEIIGVGEHNAQVILAEIGTDMSRFPTPAHPVSWAKLCPPRFSLGPSPGAVAPARATRT
jgi:transposase